MRTAIIFSVIFSAVVLCGSTEKLLPVPDGKGWKKTIKTKFQQFKPVCGEKTIAYGPQTLEMMPDGQLVCKSSESGVVFRYDVPLGLRENGKRNFQWRSRDIDHDKSRIIRHGSKYLQEVWFKGGNGVSFLYLEQSIEVMPDGRLLVKMKRTLPENSPGREYYYSALIIHMPEKLWNGKTVKADKSSIVLDKKMKTAFIRRGKDITIHAGDKTTPFSVSLPGTSEFIVRINHQPWYKAYTVNLHSRGKGRIEQAEFILDMRTGTVSTTDRRNIRGGVNFSAQENMLLPDISHKNMFSNPSLERGFEGWANRIIFYPGNNDIDWVPWELDDKEVFHGKMSLRLNAVANKQNNPPEITPEQVVASPGKYTVSFYAKTEKGKNSKVCLRIPNFHTGSTARSINNNKCRWTFNITPEWKRYKATFEVKPGFPLLSFCVYGISGSGPAKIWLDAFQLERGPKMTAFAPQPAEGRLYTAEKDNFLSAKQKINGRFEIITAKKGTSGKAKITVKNFFNEILLDVEKSFDTGKSNRIKFDLPLDELPGLGIFVVKVEYTLADGRKIYDMRRYTRINFQDMPRPNKRIFAIDYGSPEKRYLYKKVLDRWLKIGIGAKHRHASRDKKIWDIEKKYGLADGSAGMFSYVRDYNKKSGAGNAFSHYYIAATPWHVNNLKLDDPAILIRDFYLDGNGSITPEYLEKFKNAAKTMAQKFPHIKLWSMAGELSNKLRNSWWGKGTTDLQRTQKHALLLSAFVKGVKEADTGAKTYQGAPMNMSPQGGIAETAALLAACNKLGTKFDVIGIHPYRFAPENPDLDDDTVYLFDMLKKHGYDKTPVYWPEMMHWGPYEIPQWGTVSSSWHSNPKTWIGLPLTYDMGWTEKKSAAWYARSWLVALKYADRIMGATAGSQTNNNYMDVMLTPFSALIVPNTLCNILGDSVFKKDIRPAAGIRTYIFEDAQKRPVAVIWCHREEVDDGTADAPEIEIDFGSSLESVLDIMNSPRAFKPGKMKFAVTGFPLFFRGRPGTLKQITEAFENAAAGNDILTFELNPVDSKNMCLKVGNISHRQFTGTFNGKNLSVPGTGKTGINIPMKKSLKDNVITRQSLEFEIKNSSNDGKVSKKSMEFSAFTVKRVPENANIRTLKWNSLSAVNIPAGKGKGKNISGSFRIGWNSSGLFMEFKIKDDKFVHIEYQEPQERWKNDSVQFFIDTFANARNNSKTSKFDTDDYSYMILPDAAGKSAMLFRQQTVDSQLGLATQAPEDRTFAPDVPCTFSNKNGELTYRIVIPEKYLLPVTLKKGAVFGFGVFVNDSDEPGKISSSLTLATDGKGCFNRPAFWPVAVLE